MVKKNKKKKLNKMPEKAFPSTSRSLNIHVKAPSQPNITVDDLLSRKKLPDGTNKRVPGAFIIYRMALQRELKSKGHKLTLPKVSAMAADAWKIEPEEVKQEYIKLSNDAKARDNETQSSVIENTGDSNTNFPDNIITDENSLNNAVGPYSFILPPENTLYIDTSNNYIATENYYNNISNLEINNNLTTSESSLVERIRILEGRINLVAELFGIQFL